METTMCRLNGEKTTLESMEDEERSWEEKKELHSKSRRSGKIFFPFFPNPFLHVVFVVTFCPLAASRPISPLRNFAGEK